MPKLNKTINGFKICPQCKISKSTTDYYKGRVSWCKDCDKKRKRTNSVEYWKQWRRKQKQKVVDAYGGKCACCGETLLDFLTIDHVNNDGAQHKRERNFCDMYAWLKKNNYPQDRFQCLCWNCNCARRFTPNHECPHKHVVEHPR